tara:strand:- start:50 stop:346 length:297 start_codon:yes stop_codon:yes gene_type:complete
MKRVLKFYYLCKVSIIFLIFAPPQEVIPNKYEKVYKNYNDEKLIDSRDYSDLDKFIIENNSSNFISSFRKKRGKFLARINQLFLIIILIIIFIAVIKI